MRIERAPLAARDFPRQTTRHDPQPRSRPHAATHPSLPTTKAAEPIQLFNGKDLTGWEFASSDPNDKIENVWSVKDGVIHCVGHPSGYIRTKDDYTNFKLKVQWRTIKAGNSGVLIRMQCPPDKVWPRGIECQLNTNDAGDIWNIDKFPFTTDPTRVHERQTVKLHDSSEKPLGEWNQYEITADGGDLELKVNDVIQNTATDCAVLPGKIILQSEGAEIEFKNIELTPLPSRGTGAEHVGATRLFNGKDLTGWKSYMKDGSDFTKVWTAEKGVLKYAGAKSANTGYLYTEKDFANYMLRVQYRFTGRKGDSGVLLHVQDEEKIWPQCLEAQGMSGDGGDIWLLDGMKATPTSQPTSSAKHSPQQIKKYEPSSEKKLGDWNQYDITAQGDKVDLRVNYILQNCTVIKVDPQSGKIALQAQDAPMEFKDIELWPLFDPSVPREYKRVPGLEGWHITGTGNWTCKDGVIEGWQSKETHTYTHLVTDKSYHNFKIHITYKIPLGNSGLYFRLIEDTNGDVHGIQSEIDRVRDAGGMYESWGRGWLSLASKEEVAKHWKIGEWNDMDIEAHDTHVVVHVNGWQASETNDAGLVQEGPFGLQIHGGQDVDVLFKDIKIEELP